jgi:hypothetical protein
MDAADRERLVEVLGTAFGLAEDRTPAPDQPPHILLPELELPEPWQPSPARALTIWAGWPGERPTFLIDQAVLGRDGQPPRSHHENLALGEPWRGFSFSFEWDGSSDPVLAVQMWMERFVVETN